MRVKKSRQHRHAAVVRTSSGSCATLETTQRHPIRVNPVNPVNPVNGVSGVNDVNAAFERPRAPHSCEYQTPKLGLASQSPVRG